MMLGFGFARKGVKGPSGPIIKEKAIQLKKTLGGDEAEFTATRVCFGDGKIVVGKSLFQVKSFQPMMLLLKSSLKSSKYLCQKITS